MLPGTATGATPEERSWLLSVFSEPVVRAVSISSSITYVEKSALCLTVPQIDVSAESVQVQPDPMLVSHLCRVHGIFRRSRHAIFLRHHNRFRRMPRTTEHTYTGRWRPMCLLCSVDAKVFVIIARRV